MTPGDPQPGVVPDLIWRRAEDDRGGIASHHQVAGDGWVTEIAIPFKTLGLRSQNVEANPWVSVHLESGQDVVIAEGPVERITEAADSRLLEIDDLYEEKYEMRHGPPIWILEPLRVLAWTEFPKDMTRFRFP